MENATHIDKAKFPCDKGNDILVSIAYLAPVSYYLALNKAEQVHVEACEHYQKQSYRNRCTIAGSNGKIELTIPVEKSSGQKQLTHDIRISEHSDWQQQHWRSIESAYNSTPFFEYYKDDFLPFYQKKWKFLWDFNLEIQAQILACLDMSPKLLFTNEYQQFPSKNVVDLRDKIHPKRDEFSPEIPSYYQVFENKWGFLDNLSILDLLLNMGIESQLILDCQSIRH